MFAFTLIFLTDIWCGGVRIALGIDSIVSDKVDRGRELHAKLNQGIMGRSLVKSCNQGGNGALTCRYNLMVF